MVDLIMDVHELLHAVATGKIAVADAEKRLKDLPYEELGFAKLDHHRQLRTGCGEVVFCPGKETSHLTAIFQRFAVDGGRVIGTRCTQEQAAAIRAVLPEATYDPVSRMVRCGSAAPENPAGLVAICTGGTADVPVAEEAAQTAEFFGSRVVRFYDIGISGLHRLLGKLDEIRAANAIVAVAGMEGALGSVIAGLVDKPVIAVPTSVGYGASFAGLSPLLTMLNSCAAGMSVVNIDNGFGAGYQANRINLLIEQHR